ncbi:preprotein translocase subunit SecG [Spirochaeta africana]|uniref:Protein-export membrane protein SecG n=1 Tax=Spirochaeta africana (strain ATCC 700263 / DSM 8902 / Z-7692) TaxID=889378 RepID=H9UJJ5_SPIAZ|nr:preprotein translocase subunit SecG [Spirochaeta africana]AFG37688.1 protein translocase, SecG subunit [Spirochaeta africana DSM 8902]
MGLLSVLLLIVFIISAILLAVMVLIQDEGGDSLGGIFGGSGSQQIGNRRGNILTKTTSVLGAVFILSSLALAFVNRTPSVGDVEGAARRIEGESGVVEWWNAPDANGDDQSVEQDEQ